METRQISSTHRTIREWVSLYGNDLYGWALHKTGGKETAEDLVQETFLAAFQSIDRFQGKSQPKTWLFSILNNKIMDYHRKKFREATMNQSRLNQRMDGANGSDEAKMMLYEVFKIQEQHTCGRPVSVGYP